MIHSLNADHNPRAMRRPTPKWVVSFYDWMLDALFAHVLTTGRRDYAAALLTTQTFETASDAGAGEVPTRLDVDVEMFFKVLGRGIDEGVFSKDLMIEISERLGDFRAGTRTTPCGLDRQQWRDELQLMSDAILGRMTQRSPEGWDLFRLRFKNLWS